MPHQMTAVTPAAVLWKPAKLSIWHNDTEGVCTVSEEAFAKATYDPEIFIRDETVQTWAAAHGAIDGAIIADILDLMVDQGFLQDGVRYDDGKATGVDWTNAPLLANAISMGPVKIGVAANQLENAVKGDPPASGWFGIGFEHDDQIDHCVSLCGYGAIEWLACQLGVQVPVGVDGNQQGYGLFTWGCIGIIDIPSMIAITGEAWLRLPTTVIVK